MTETQPIHVPVMLNEVLQGLAPHEGYRMVDATLGGGGHTRALAESVGSSGLVIALDRDPEALAAAQRNLKGLPVILSQANFCDLPEVLKQLELDSQPLDSVLLDLGVSSDQLADTERGFSFDAEGPLDLRFNPNEGEPAWRLLKRLSQKHLADLIYAYGEERYSRSIARQIVRRRQKNPIRTAADLAHLVRRCVPNTQRINPATRTFQALRIAVNDELKSLETALRRIPECLVPGGKIAVISFHSLEDRQVKTAFRDDDRYEVLTKKPVRPTEKEIAGNPRARSAKLRIAKRTR